MGGRCGSGRTTPARHRGRRPSPVRSPPAAPRARRRPRAQRCGREHHPTPARAPIWVPPRSHRLGDPPASVAGFSLIRSHRKSLRECLVPPPVTQLSRACAGRGSSACVGAAAAVGNCPELRRGVGGSALQNPVASRKGEAKERQTANSGSIPGTGSRPSQRDRPPTWGPSSLPGIDRSRESRAGRADPRRSRSLP